MIQELPPRAFFLTILLIPITSLFWWIGVGQFKLNWIVFLLFPITAALMMIKTRSIDRSSLTYFIVIALYLFIFFLNDGEYISLLRILTSLLPLFFLRQISDYSTQINQELFWRLFFVSLSLPLFISIMQLAGEFPFSDPGKAIWLVDRGRISGGYLKPNNLVIYFFPAFLYGVAIYKRKRLLGLFLIILYLLLAITATLRIAIIISFVVLISSFFPAITNRIVLFYYTRCIPIIVGIVGIFLLGLSFDLFGPHLALRERLPVWQAHSHLFLHSDLPTILLGNSAAHLTPYYRDFPEIMHFDEVHNNSIRIIRTFGILGFTLYCLFVRQIIIQINKARANPYLANCSFLSYALYSITNEPVFYASIFWCLIVWVVMNCNPQVYGQASNPSSRESGSK